jgi:hypothetical protein
MYSSVCILPNGSVMLNATEQECQSLGECTIDCPMQCNSKLGEDIGVCVQTGVDSANCSGTWDSEQLLCYTTHSNSSYCQKLGGTFQECEILSIEECLDCQQNQSCSVQQDILQCYVNDRVKCQSATECNAAGQCSSNDLLLKVDQTYEVLCN